MSSLHYKSSDSLFAVTVHESELDTILHICSEAHGNETGGLLIGYYNHNYNCAIVTEITGPSDDSASGKTWFYRGIGGLQKLLNTVWCRRRHYYLGEWHFHPGASPNLSSDDINAMNNIANSLKYNCPEPLLLIVGENSELQWNGNFYVFFRKQKYITLKFS